MFLPWVYFLTLPLPSHLILTLIPLISQFSSQLSSTMSKPISSLVSFLSHILILSAMQHCLLEITYCIPNQKSIMFSLDVIHLFWNCYQKQEETQKMEGITLERRDLYQVAFKFKQRFIRRVTPVHGQHEVSRTHK